MHFKALGKRKLLETFAFNFSRPLGFIFLQNFPLARVRQVFCMCMGSNTNDYKLHLKDASHKTRLKIKRKGFQQLSLAESFKMHGVTLLSDD